MMTRQKKLEIADRDAQRPAAQSLAAEECGNQADAPHTGRLTGAADDAEEKYEIDAFVGHSRDNYLQEYTIEVRWRNDKVTTKEPERIMHEDAPQTLFEYWRSNGGRPENPERPGFYNFSRIVRHDKNCNNFKVEWVRGSQDINSGLIRDTRFASYRTTSSARDESAPLVSSWLQCLAGNTVVVAT
ncbi:chromo domain [Trichoderma arundinaceum]|uniref:Chromo domain n=1 Tax=Trichoderma arundinaceum TaxID=490622 RepID=A0A395NBW1_TRIAR|nr:chromo domain [Trichoderma arundinaceum]